MGTFMRVYIGTTITLTPKPSTLNRDYYNPNPKTLNPQPSLGTTITLAPKQGSIPAFPTIRTKRIKAWASCLLSLQGFWGFRGLGFKVKGLEFLVVWDLRLRVWV